MRCRGNLAIMKEKKILINSPPFNSMKILKNKKKTGLIMKIYYKKVRGTNKKYKLKRHFFRLKMLQQKSRI